MATVIHASKAIRMDAEQLLRGIEGLAQKTGKIRDVRIQIAKLF